MKKTNAFIAAALAASMLTSCGGTDTAEVTSAESTVSETTESEVTEATEATTLTEPLTEDTTSVESVESVSDTEAIEKAENTHWDTIVYDTTYEFDVTDWNYGDGGSEYYVKPGTICTVTEAISRLNIPDEVTSYLYEQSLVYKDWVDNDKGIRNISSGVKDFDSDGADEIFYAINYLYDTRADIIVYDEIDGIVYWSGNDDIDFGGLTNIGYYFVSDPAVECESLGTYNYEKYLIWEDANMYFTEDNIFIGCDWEFDMYNHVGNRYFKLIENNGVYHMELVGEGYWGIHKVKTEDETLYYRTTGVDGDIPCVLIQ